ncbi:MAG: asparagine--tRNA ligase [Deltaproteobacteria bacterium]|nr:asparagine--tRNA ligase [Deltaproteobacteria bacterium]
MKRSLISDLMKSDIVQTGVLIQGWVRTRRDSKGFSFIELNDGSSLKNMQVLADETLPGYNEVVLKLTTGSALAVEGDLINSPGAGQRWEIKARNIRVYDIAPESYPLQKKRHSDEYLRTIAHLRPRTNKYSAAFRIRSELAYGIHKFFKEKSFTYIHTPIITASDCEGAGQMFRVTTLEPTMQKPVDFTQDFFGKQSSLTVSGQLEAELFALALGNVYTFGPTFRAENSNTRRHAAEFWMIEPEMAFCDLSDNMSLAEELIKYVTAHVMEECPDDIDLFARFVEKDLTKQLEKIVGSEFVRLPYRDALLLIEKSGQTFEFEVPFGQDLQSEHEQFLTEDYFKKPVIVYNYPASIKPFYMRLNDDNETVAAMDVLVGRVGEIIGGSQREERLDVLERRMDECGLEKDSYWWYLDSRRFGSVPHSGFGLGFERLVMMVTGIANIRDVIPFPRTPKNIEF